MLKKSNYILSIMLTKQRIKSTRPYLLTSVIAQNEQKLLVDFILVQPM